MYMRKYNQFDTVILKDGRVAAIVDFIGEYYIVDVGSSPADWDTIEIREEDIVGKGIVRIWPITKMGNIY